MKNKFKYILFALLLLMAACSEEAKQADTITPGMETGGTEENAQSAPTLLPTGNEK